jgi:hypothetical protein
MHSFNAGRPKFVMYVLGIHPDGEYFKVCLIKSVGSNSQIVFLQEFKKDILDLNQLKRRLLKESRYKTDSVVVVSALTPEEVFVKKLSFPFKRKRLVMKALPFQMEKLLPFSEEHVTTVAEIITKKKESDVVLYTFFNETLQSHLQDIKTIGFESDRVSTVAAGLSRFKSFFAHDQKVATILYFGWEKSYVVHVAESDVKYSLVVDVGFKMIIDAAREDHPTIEDIEFDFIKSEIGKYFKKELLSGAVREVLEKFRKGLFRSFEYIKKKEGLEHLAVLHLGYNGISEEILMNMTDISSSSIEISPHLEFGRQQLRSYAIEIGLALDYSQKNEESLQFRTGEFASSKHVSRIKRKIKIFLGLSAICSAVALAAVTTVFIKKESLIRDRFNYIVTLGGENPVEYKGIQKGLFFAGDFQREVDFFLEKIKWHKQEGVFLSEPFLVSSCLQEIKKEIKPKEIHYELVAYPTVDKPKEKFIVKLDVLFEAHSLEEAKKIGEKIFPKNRISLEPMKEKNVYQMVFVFKQEV